MAQPIGSKRRNLFQFEIRQAIAQVDVWVQEWRQARRADRMLPLKRDDFIGKSGVEESALNMWSPLDQ